MTSDIVLLLKDNVCCDLTRGITVLIPLSYIVPHIDKAPFMLYFGNGLSYFFYDFLNGKHEFWAA